MVESRLKLEAEVRCLFPIIDEKKNFVLSGGAGSGKTYSLIQLMRQILAENSNQRIACVTYTNAAVREIESRINNKDVNVRTIHEFLWENIKSFQVELKVVLIQLINDVSEKIFKNSNGSIENDFYQSKTIQYKEYTQLSEGIISHDELLIVANRMFADHKKLCDIVKDKYNFIFVDEYQDTEESVIQIFLDYFKKSGKNNVVGFFGDSMQSIYETGVGNLRQYIDNEELQEVVKSQNRRNPRLVYELANKLRTDRIVQVSSQDESAPNMRDNIVKEGQISFYYSESEDKLDELKKILDWETQESSTKELNLTHNLIAPKAGFSKLMKVYDNDKILSYKDRIVKYIKENNILLDFTDMTFGQVIKKLIDSTDLDSEKNKILPTPGMKEFINNNPELYKTALSNPFNKFRSIYLDKELLLDDKKNNVDGETNEGSKRDALIAHLFKIQRHISLYQEEKYNEFLRKTEFKVESVSDKMKIKEIIDNLKNMSGESISDVIEYAHRNRICKKDDKLSGFINQKEYVYHRVSQIEFVEFQNLYNYLEGRTPFSTQHKIKGNEYDNVLMVLDNGNWRNYNFEYLLNDNILESLSHNKKQSFPRILERTQKIFYVCCTRAKENLAIYYRSPSNDAIEKAKEWFGEANVHEI